MIARRDLTRDLLGIALVCAVAAGWIVAPSVVRHQAGVDPLLHQTRPLEDVHPAGGNAWRAILPETPAAGPWAPRHIELLERGEPLMRAPPRAVRQGAAGRYAVTDDGEILFVASTASTPSAGAPPEAPVAARPDPDDYSARHPRVLPALVIRGAAALLLVATLAIAVVALRGLARSGVLARAAASTLVALGAWAAVATVFEKKLPWTGSDLIGQKIGILASDLDDYQAIFIGSSRIYRQVDPATFDAVFAEVGVPMRSFNLGAPDMRMLEVLYLARWVLDRAPRDLDLLVIDAESDPLFIREENLRNERIVRWHDPRNVAAIVGEVWRTGPWGSRVGGATPAPAAAIERAARHVSPFALHVTQLGRGPSLVTRLTARSSTEFPLDQRGFFAGDEEMAISSSAAQREELELFSRRLHDDLDRYRRDIARLASSPRVGMQVDPFEIELFAELERIAADAGVRVVFLLDPGPFEKPNLVWAAENGTVSTLLRFDDPAGYPELYDPALRFDRHHVSKAGALIYTREIARRILDSGEPAKAAEAAAAAGAAGAAQ